jgi:dipeptidase
MKPENVICPICNKPMIRHKDLWISADGTFNWEHITEEENEVKRI